MLVDREYSLTAQNAVDGPDAGSLVGDLAEYGDENYQIELRFGEGELGAGITCRVSHGEKALRLQFATGLREHFRLQVEQLEASSEDSPREFDAEVPRARPDLQHPAPLHHRQALRELFRGDEESADRIVNQPRALVRKATAAEDSHQPTADMRFSHSKATRHSVRFRGGLASMT